MSDETDQRAGGEAEREAGTDERQLVMQKIYLKDASFEAPTAPEIFGTQQEWNPEIDVDLNTSARRMEDGNHHVVLTVTVTARQGESTAFLAEVQQAGVFTVRGFSDEQLGPLLGAYCPATLFPFAREAVADLVAKGGFPQLLLAPVNFDALYRDHVQRQHSQGGAGAQTSH